MKYRKQEAIPPMAVENVSGKFIRADSCYNENARTYINHRRDYTVAEENNGPKIGSKIFDDDAAIEIVGARERGKRISCHKQRLAHVRDAYSP